GCSDCRQWGEHAVVHVHRFRLGDEQHVGDRRWRHDELSEHDGGSFAVTETKAGRDSATAPPLPRSPQRTEALGGCCCCGCWIARAAAAAAAVAAMVALPESAPAPALGAETAGAAIGSQTQPALFIITTNAPNFIPTLVQTCSHSVTRSFGV